MLTEEGLMHVTWEERHTRWKGDDFTGFHEDSAPPTQRSGVVHGFVQQDAVAGAVVNEDGTRTLTWMRLEDLTILRRR